MSYTHLTKTELVFIEEYHSLGHTGRKIAKNLKQGHETIYRAIRQLLDGFTALEIYLTYKEINPIVDVRISNYLLLKLTINKKTRQDWTPD